MLGYLDLLNDFLNKELLHFDHFLININKVPDCPAKSESGGKRGVRFPTVEREMSIMRCTIINPVYNAYNIVSPALHTAVETLEFSTPGHSQVQFLVCKPLLGYPGVS